MLKGEAKKTYQREYMRNRRKKQVVRPSVLDPRAYITEHAYLSENIEIDKEPTPHILIDADGNAIYEEG